MRGYAPIQTSFAGGELSPHVWGNLGADVYARGLAYARNFMVLPQGPLLMRAGSELAATMSPRPRLIPFRMFGSLDEYVVVLSDALVQIRDRATGALQTIFTNLVANGRFDSNIDHWATDGVTAPVWEAGALAFSELGVVRNVVVIPTTVGNTYRFQVRVRATAPTDTAVVGLNVKSGGVVLASTLSAAGWVKGTWQTLSFTFTATTTGVVIELVNNQGSFKTVWDDVIVVDVSASATSGAAPWTLAQLGAIQHDGEPAANRLTLVHPNVQPYVVRFTAPDVWEVTAASFVSPPAEWGDSNWPSVIEAGFQGRMWFGGTPNEPSEIWGSKSGAAFDLGVSSPVVASDSLSFIVSTKGEIRWLRGQKALLAGSETVEHAIAGSNRLITPGDVNVQDESASGAASVQAVHIGDQALWVAREGRHVRAMNYDLQADGWISRALTFLADHITVGGIAELHFAPAPFPVVLALLATGDLVACTYDRAEQVVAWWRVDLGAPVRSLCVLGTADGSELWLAVDRASGICLERLPLHEVGVDYLDSAVTLTAAAEAVSGLGHLEGETVRIKVDGAVFGDAVVTGGSVPVAGVADGTAVLVGLPFNALARTLPRDRLGKAVRTPQLLARIYDSALPLFNGRRAADRTPATPLDTPEALRSGLVEMRQVGWNEGDQLEIEQDLPFRTEVLALLGVTQANEG